MQTVSICFSGHPRSILNHKDKWHQYFDLLRKQYHLRIFFHSWSETGTVKRDGQRFVEGSYDPSPFRRFDELLDFLNPEAFQVSSPIETYGQALLTLGEVYISSWQAPVRAILSQLHSVCLSNHIRNSYEKAAGPSDAVIKMRFDLVPSQVSTNEIDSVLAHQGGVPLLFAPSPHWHGHPGGGGGCVTCQAFFNEHPGGADYLLNSETFSLRHQFHSNDICDLFAIGAPHVIDRYSNMFLTVGAIYARLKEQLSEAIPNYVMADVAEDPGVKKIVSIRSGEFDIEGAPVFVPEKLIRAAMKGFMVLHGDAIFTIARE